MPIVLSRVGFEWPTGQPVLNNISLSFHENVYALVGVNGIGKTTLARLISGELKPTSGFINSQAGASYFQQTESPPDRTAGEYIFEDEYHYIPEVAAFLGDLSLDRCCSNLSGGEWTRVRLAKVIASHAFFLILDEPTNHLDREGRQAVFDLLARFKGGVLLITHDRELLSHANAILEITSQGLTVFSGSWAEFEHERDQERQRLQAQLERAKRRRDVANQERHERLEAQTKRTKQGRLNAVKAGVPRILRGKLKRAAQVTYGEIDRNAREEIDRSIEQTWEAYKNLKIDPVMYARLPKVSVPNGKLVVEAERLNFRYAESHADLWKQSLSFSFRSPLRLAVHGANGSGKSTLMNLWRNEKLNGAVSGILKMGTLRAVYLNQNHSSLNAELSVLENVRATTRMDESELRSLLAMFLFAGDRVDQRVSSLSGGELLRAALAKALLATPPAELLILDEPTNNLDLKNTEFLENLLNQYKGALVVISHDEVFIKRIGITAELRLSP